MEKSICDLYCVVERQFFYFNLISSDKELVSEDIVIADNGLDLFERPDIISSFFKVSFAKYQLDKVFFSLVQKNFALAPNNIPIDEVQHWMPKSDGYLLVDNLDEVKLGYYVDTGFYDHLVSVFPQANFSHIVSINLCDQQIQDGVLSQAINGYRFISMTESSKLIFANLYECETKLASLYYTLMPYQLKDKDVENTPLYYVSNNDSGPSAAELREYIRIVEDVENDNPRRTLENYQSMMLDKLISCVS